MVFCECCQLIYNDRVKFCPVSGRELFRHSPSPTSSTPRNDNAPTETEASLSRVNDLLGSLMNEDVFSDITRMSPVRRIDAAAVGAALANQFEQQQTTTPSGSQTPHTFPRTSALLGRLHGSFSPLPSVRQQRAVSPAKTPIDTAFEAVEDRMAQGVLDINRAQILTLKQQNMQLVLLFCTFIRLIFAERRS